MTDSSTGRCAGRYVDPLRHDADDVGWMVNHTPLLSRRTGAGHEVDRNIRLVPGFRFVEKLHACRLPWIRQLKIRDENDETFMIADFPGHRSCLIAAYRNFCGALDWFSLSVGGVGVSRGGVEFVPVDAGPVCGRDAVVRFGRRCLFALPQGVGDE